jgi:hypothetical protein
MNNFAADLDQSRSTLRYSVHFIFRKQDKMLMDLATLVRILATHKISVKGVFKNIDTRRYA